MIYFDEKKRAFAYKITGYIAAAEESVWQNYAGTDKWDIVDGVFTDITDTSEYKSKKEREKRQELDMKFLTKREVFLALYRAKGLTPDALKAQIKDTEALIEFEYAESYFRGNPLINQIGQMLGYNSDDLDYLFENKELPPSFTLTINPVPENATVTLWSTGAIQRDNSITVIQNRTVTYTVTAEGYIKTTGEKIVTGDETLTVELEKEQSPDGELDSPSVDTGEDNSPADIKPEGAGETENDLLGLDDVDLSKVTESEE